jgi:hypothetical protein
MLELERVPDSFLFFAPILAGPPFFYDIQASELSPGLSGIPLDMSAEPSSDRGR